jgi:hypothetical protein
MRMSLQPTTSGVLQNVLTPALNARPALDFYESC